jgi:hypothetical protein
MGSRNNQIMDNHSNIGDRGNWLYFILRHTARRVAITGKTQILFLDHPVYHGTATGIYHFVQ